MYITENFLLSALKEQDCFIEETNLSDINIKLNGLDLHKIINFVVSHKEKPPIFSIEDLFLISCSYFNIAPAKIQARNRRREICNKRQIIQTGLYDCFKFSCQRIGEVTGGLKAYDHTTIINSRNTVKDLCDSDENFKSTYTNFVKFLNSKKL